MEELAPIIGVAVMFYFSLLIVKDVMDYKIRNKLIDKGMVDEKVKNIIEARPRSEDSAALKWGMVLVGIGAGIIINYLLLRLIPADFQEEATAGLVFFMAGIALIAYYAIARKKGKS